VESFVLVFTVGGDCMEDFKVEDYRKEEVESWVAGSTYKELKSMGSEN
jgi:hypothetical protein